MDSPNTSKQNSYVNRNQFKKAHLLHQKPSLQQQRSRIDPDKEQDHIKRILISKFIENDQKKLRILDHNIGNLNLIVTFSSNFSLSFNLPPSFTLLQLNQIISSYSKIHLKNSPHHHSYAGIYIPFVLQNNRIAQQNEGVEKILNKRYQMNSFALQVLEFIHQNSLLSQKFTQFDQKSFFFVKSNHFETIADLFQIRVKTLTSIACQNNKILKLKDNQEDFPIVKKNECLKIRVRYDLIEKQKSDYEKIKNIQKQFKTQQYFSQNNIQTFNGKFKDQEKIAFQKHYNSIESNANVAQSFISQNIYIKQYTQPSQKSSLQSNKSQRQSNQFLSDFEENLNNFITFDPKQILDSGRLRTENKSFQKFMKWLNGAEIVDYQLLKDLIFLNKPFTQNMLRTHQFLHFPLRLKGNSQTFEMYVVSIKNINPVLVYQTNQLIKKIISSDLCLSCQINQFYFLQFSNHYKSTRQLQSILKMQKDKERQQLRKKKTGKYHIFIAEAPPYQQLTLISYLSSILKEIVSREVKLQNQNAFEQKLAAINKMMIQIFYQVENLIKQMVGFGNLFVSQLNKQNYDSNPVKLKARNKQKLGKDNRKFRSLFESPQFWHIGIQQKHQFIKKQKQQQFSILSLIVCQNTNKFIQRRQMRIDFPQLVKRIISFYQKNDENIFCNNISQQMKGSPNHFLSLLKTKLKSELTSFAKTFFIDSDLHYNLNFDKLLTQNQSKIDIIRQNVQKNMHLFNQNSVSNILLNLTSSFLQKIVQCDEIFDQTIIEKEKQTEQGFLFGILEKRLNSYHTLKSQQFRKFQNQICSIQPGQMSIHEYFTRPKSFYFSAGQALDIYEKQTTLKKKKQSQSTSHKNSLDLHYPAFTTDFNHSELLTHLNSKSQDSSSSNKKVFVQKQKKIPRTAIKRDKKTSKSKNNSKVIKKQQTKIKL